MRGGVRGGIMVSEDDEVNAGVIITGEIFTPYVVYISNY